MIKKASFFSPSTAPRNVGIRSSSGLGDSPIFWMRSVCDGGAVSILAARSLKECQNVVLKISSFGSWKGLPGQICLPLKGKDAQRVLWVAQLSSSSLKYSSRGRRTPRITMVKVGVSGLNYNTLSEREQAASSTEGPSCIYVGPLEKAEKARLEALYQQARDSYYSGRPLIVDDMFDRVETMLRWHGSKVILKYPRCSLKRYSAYADAEIDASQMWALASIWGLLLASGIFAAAGPPACAINQACKKSVHLRFESHGVSAASETVMYMNGLLAISMGLVIGIPVAMAAVVAYRSFTPASDATSFMAVDLIEGLWRGDLVAMKGCCPSCGEEVYAFVRADQSGQPQHKTECHVCEHPLMFRANVERSSSHPGHFWAYGRVYLSTQSKDLSPNGSKF